MNAEERGGYTSDSTMETPRNGGDVFFLTLLYHLAFIKGMHVFCNEFFETCLVSLHVADYIN